MVLTAKITSKGQITIPKKIRQMIKGDVVEFEVNEGKIVLKPVTSVGGSLSKYVTGYSDVAEAREKTWSDVAHEKAQG